MDSDSIFIYYRNSVMRDFYRLADYIHIDGMALIFMGKLLNLPFKREHRVTYADWIWSLMAEAAEKKWRVFYLGSKPGIADKGAVILRNTYPNLQIATAHGYFSLASDESENQAVIEQLKAYLHNISQVL